MTHVRHYVRIQPFGRMERDAGRQRYGGAMAKERGLSLKEGHCVLKKPAAVAVADSSVVRKPTKRSRTCEAVLVGDATGAARDVAGRVVTAERVADVTREEHEAVAHVSPFFSHGSAGPPDSPL